MVTPWKLTVGLYMRGSINDTEYTRHYRTRKRAEQIRDDIVDAINGCENPNRSIRLPLPNSDGTAKTTRTDIITVRPIDVSYMNAVVTREEGARTGSSSRKRKGRVIGFQLPDEQPSEAAAKG